MDARVRPLPKPVAKPDRKHDILLAAEKLFAQHSYHAVSIRQIAEEAGVPLALVGYYYGQKHELFHAIFEHWAGTTNERLTALHEVEQQPHDRQKLRRIVEAFIGPVIRLRASAQGGYYAQLMTQGLSSQQGEADRVLRDFFDPMADTFISALLATLRHDLPQLTRGTVAWCYQFALGALLHHINDMRVERLSHGESRPNDPLAAPMLIDFIVHGIRGVVTPAPSPRPRNRRLT